LAEYVARLGKSVVEIERLSGDLRGKLSGAVGAYNATSMLMADPEALEKAYLDQLGLAPSEIATQMVEPEYLLRLLLELNVAFGIIANLADDLRHLQRSEIDEVREHFSATQVGSSTMPQKRNPWNSEHVKSLWKAFAPRVMSFFMDQISEHQRDLTNSASSRFVAEYLAGLTAAAERLRRIVERLAVNRPRMQELLEEGGGSVLAEPAYILLALSGVAEAHEKLRLVTLDAEQTGKSFGASLQANEEIWKAISEELRNRTGLDAEEFFSSPEHYRGIAETKTERICTHYHSIMESTKERLL
jgi:adenylosuccinate lyase